MAVVTLSAVIHREADLYVAECPELGTVSQGSTIEEAVGNLKEATELYLEEQAEPITVAPAILTTFSIETANAEAAQGFRGTRDLGTGASRFRTCTFARQSHRDGQIGAGTGSGRLRGSFAR